MTADAVRLSGRCLLMLALLTAGALSNTPALAKITLTETIGERQIALQIYGFTQLEARGGHGVSDDGGVQFAAQRVRLAFCYFHGPISTKLFVDFNQSFTSREGGLPKAIKDAFITYTFSNAAFLRLGMIKTPLGMEFTTQGWNLDIVDRAALAKSLVLERDMGVMLSGRLIGQERYADAPQLEVTGLEMGTERQGHGFGYDIGVFNPAGRSRAVIWDEDQLGSALAWAVRAHYDLGPPLHAEVAFGRSEEAGGPHTADYEVVDIGVATELWNLGVEAKAEYIEGSSIRGVDGWDQRTATATVGYMLRRDLQAVIATHRARADHPAGGSTELANTYIGLSWYLVPVSFRPTDLQRHRLMLNYIVASGDRRAWTGLGGFRDDSWVVSWQYKY
jgi:hypothetical protein